MGLIWDLIQHNQIRETQDQAFDLEDRVRALEVRLHQTNDTLTRLLQALEQRFGDDLDGDGRVG